MAEAEPPTKKAKVEEEAPVEEVEKETDAAADKTPKIKDQASFLVQDTTLNVAESTFGNMLTCISDGGFQYLLAGARANVGVKSGRYMFEVNVVELMQQKQDAANVTGRAPQPRNFFRVGLSTAGSSLMIGEDEESVCFDAEGHFIHNKKKTAVGSKFERSMNVCILLNLDAKSPNANTVSVFKEGKRICEPQALPENLHGKALFPTVTYRNVTVHYNFGAAAHDPLPFSCRMLQDAAAKDVVVTKDAAPTNGKYTAVFPCGLPEEGTFQWLEGWLKENPGYTELSDRALLEWAEKSAIPRLKPYASVSCLDKPEMGFGLPTLDDKSVQKMILLTASIQRRNFVVPEIHANLMKDERATLLESFGAFKKVALVVCGEPPAAFKKATQDSVLKAKQATADVVFKKKLDIEKHRKEQEKTKKEQEKKKKKADKAAKKLAEARKKKLEETLKKRAEDKKKAEEEKVKSAEAAKKAAAAKAAGEEVAVEEETKEEEEVKEETKEETKEEEEEKSEESEEEPMEVEEADPVYPAAELTAEEKAIVFKPSTVPDVTEKTLNAGFAKYSFPDKAEGFDEVKYEWQNAAKSTEHLSAWRQDKKVTARIEDLVPGDWFAARTKEWASFLQTCKQKQNDYKNQLAKRAQEKAAKVQMKQMKIAQAKQKVIQDKAAAERREKVKEAIRAKAAQAREMKAKLRADKIAAGEEVEPEEEEPVKEAEEEAKPMEVEEAKAEEEEEEPEDEEVMVDLEGVDVFGVEDIFEIGGKPVQQPIFSQFNFEDWALMSLRFELSLLVHAFKKDVKDPERSGIHEDNIGFYYQKYFKKALNATFFGVKSVRELLRFLEDTLTLTKKNILDTMLPGEFETLNVFVLLAEEFRRDRQRRMDLGQADAKINMQTVGIGGLSGLGGLGMQMAAPAGVSAGQMNAAKLLVAQRAGAMMGQGVRPAGMQGQFAAMAVNRPMVQPSMIRPTPAQYGPGQTTAWRPQTQAWAAGAQAPRPLASMLIPKLQGQFGRQM